MKNQGVEVDINVDVFKHSQVRWNTGLALSHNSNKVTKLYGGKDIIDGTSIIREGESYYSWWSREWAGSAHKQHRQLLVIVKISAAHQVVRDVIRHALECFSSLIHSFLIDHGRADIAIDDQNRKYYSPCPGSTYILFYHRLICGVKNVYGNFGIPVC